MAGAARQPGGTPGSAPASSRGAYPGPGARPHGRAGQGGSGAAAAPGYRVVPDSPLYRHAPGVHRNTADAASGSAVGAAGGSGQRRYPGAAAAPEPP